MLIKQGAKLLAKNIVRMTFQMNKITEFVGQLSAVSLRIGGISTLNELSTAMEEAGKAITTVSSSLDAGRLSEMAKTLAKEDAKLDMKEDMMTDILDGIGEWMDDPAQQEEIYKQVLQEAGLEVGKILPDAEVKQVVKPVKEEKKEEDDSLDAMLKSLQK